MFSTVNEQLGSTCLRQAKAFIYCSERKVALVRQVG